MRLPDFFLVGHSKSGTTALHEMLSQHPGVFLPAAKEPWFFAPELRDHPPPRPEGIPDTIEAYARWFDGAAPGQLVGEASPQYLRSQLAAAEIAAACPEARIVAIFREPSEFLRSLHLQFLQTGVESETDLGRALELEPERSAGRHLPRHGYWPSSLTYSRHVRYTEQLRRFHEHFPRERVHVLLYDDFATDNAGAVRGIFRFLGLEESVAIAPVRANPTVQARSQRLNELVQSLGVGRGPVSRGVKGAVKLLTPTAMRRRVFHSVQERVVFGEPDPPDPQLMARLREQLRPEVESFADYLQRDLVRLWRYGGD
jgi:hypothetical protein